MTFRNLICTSAALVLAASAAFASPWEGPAPSRPAALPPSRPGPAYQAPSRPVYRQPAYNRPAHQPPAQPEHPEQTTRREFRITGETDDGYFYELDLYSQHLDADVRTLYTFGATYVPETEFGTYGAAEMVEADLEFRLFRFDEFLWGSFDAWIDAHVIGFIDNPGMSVLPDAVIDAALDIGQHWRFVNGWSTEIRAAPGIYSDVAEPTFGVPITLNFYFAINPELSLKLGGTFRPGWDIPVIPNVGFAWQPADVLRIEAMVPRSELTLFPNHILSFYGAFEWRNVTYGLADDEPGAPDAVTLDDMFATAGVALCPFGDYRLVGEYGVFVQRELSADVESDKAVDLSKEAFFRVMIKGAF
ncbi:MAG: hypothetical protein ACOX9C_11505 [Kiritimatiellia bacterium]